MEKEGRGDNRLPERDLLLQWGNRKRHRCFKVKKEQALEKSDGSALAMRSTHCVVRAERDGPVHHPKRLLRILDSAPGGANRKSHSSSPDKEDRYYTTRGSVFEDGGGKLFPDGVGADKGFVWPRFFISLSSKEKEEDFMAMKGCKLPQRPRKRAKYIQKSLLLVSPGAWLSELSQERYEVRGEKKSSKKRPRGLKAMGFIESDSD
ncbi:hypothetical protein H6P81_009577 [Aristolochia fimbriata]|uniref:Uncharacterized protein n=1 Tax=Aristolochia fimbriata TaxID=158543 RepID=A0AAV7EPF3_ARIFI|nr:hypothetical protein H6P81_009577 [Aristolochia fimbriata]